MVSEQQKQILVVEDDQATALMVRKRLEVAGFTVHTAEAGASALAWAGEHWPGLVILDLRLPDMSGYEVARGLRKLYGPWCLPILMLTGMDKPIDELRGFAYGADAYLTKPYNAGELLKTVSVLMESKTVSASGGDEGREDVRI